VVTLLLGTNVTGLQLVLPLFVYGIGVGLATAQLTSITLSDIPVERSGLASGANSTMRQIGSALGIAILGTILFVSLGDRVRENLADVPGLPPAAAAGIATAMETSGGQALPGIREQSDAIVPLLDDAFADAARLTGSAAFVFVLFGLGFSLLLPDTRPRVADGADVSAGPQPPAS
jgi:hypothetical protein